MEHPLGLYFIINKSPTYPLNKFRINLSSKFVTRIIPKSFQDFLPCSGNVYFLRVASKK